MYMLIVLPMWMNFLLRTYAWLTLLERTGVINSALSMLGLPSLDILYTNEVVVLGMVYNFLPFMILPIYSVLSKIDQSVIKQLRIWAETIYRVQAGCISPEPARRYIRHNHGFHAGGYHLCISRLLGGGGLPS